MVCNGYDGEWQTGKGGVMEPDQHSKLACYNECMGKPPLGLIPVIVHNRNRIAEILAAMKRYNEAKMIIPTIWWQELETLIDS